MIDIIKHNWKWRFTPSKRKYTKYIILHHAAARSCTPEQIHEWHLQRDGGTWAGIGYNFFVRKNGEIHEGRPLECSGAHCTNYNSISVGVCFEGDYDNEFVMPLNQLSSGRKLIKYLKSIYPDAEIKMHRDFQNTACPGKFFPVGEVLNMKDENENAVIEKRFNSVNEMPDGEIKNTIKVLVDAEIIKGVDTAGNLDLSYDMCRIITICNRLCKVYTNER